MHSLLFDRAANGYEAVTRYTQTGVPQWKTGLTVNANGTPDYVVRNEINNSDALAISSSNFVTLPTGYLLLGSTNASVGINKVERSLNYQHMNQIQERPGM